MALHPSFNVDCRLPTADCLVNEHRHAGVDFRREFGVGARAEDGRGLGVRIDAGDVLGGQREPALGLGKLAGVGQEEGEAGLLLVMADGE